MINSKAVGDLHSYVQAKCKAHIAACKERGVEVVVVSTLRDAEYQANLYAQGRTRPGAKVTNTKLIGAHGFGLAYDMVPDARPGNGKDEPTWDLSKPDIARVFEIIYQEGKKLGATCGADWKSIVDRPHYEYTEGLSYAQLRAGKRPSFWHFMAPTKIPTATIRPYVRNDKEVVILLQKKLNEKGSYRLAVDGDYGQITLGAVRDFQRSHNLTVDGIVGANTWRILFS